MPKYSGPPQLHYHLSGYFRSYIILNWFKKIRPSYQNRTRSYFYFFFHFTANSITNTNDDCSQLSFEIYKVCVAQKLQISEFLIDFFSPGPWPLRRPPEATISTSATSMGYQILAKDLSFHMRLCLLL